MQIYYMQIYKVLFVCMLLCAYLFPLQTATFISSLLKLTKGTKSSALHKSIHRHRRSLSLSLSPSLSLDRIVQRRQQATVPTIQFDITNSMGMTESCCKQWWLCAASKSHFPIDSIPPTPMLNCLKRLFIAHHALVIMAISQQSEAS